MPKKRVDGEIKVANVFAALNTGKKAKKAAKAKEAAEAEDKKNVFAFVSQKSTSAWGDESDDEMTAAVDGGLEQADGAADEDADENEEADSDEDSEEEEEDEQEEEEESPKEEAAKPAAAVQVKKAEPPRSLSKKEKKQLELEEFEAALAELGIKAEEPKQAEKETVEDPVSNDASGEASSSSKKKKKGKKKPAAEQTTSADVEAPAVVDIKSVLKTKTKKKKTTESSAVKLAREAAQAAKAKKKNRDKATFNEFSY